MRARYIFDLTRRGRAEPGSAAARGGATLNDVGMRLEGSGGAGEQSTDLDTVVKRELPASVIKDPHRAKGAVRV